MSSYLTRAFEEKYGKKKFNKHHPSHSNKIHVIIDESGLDLPDETDKLMEEIGNRFIPEKMYSTRFNPRWTTELILNSVGYKAKYTFDLDYVYTTQEYCEKIGMENPFVFHGNTMYQLFYIDSIYTPEPEPAGYGCVLDNKVTKYMGFTLKLNHRFKSLSFPAQILFMSLVTNAMLIRQNFIDKLAFLHCVFTFSYEGYLLNRYRLGDMVFNPIMSPIGISNFNIARKLFYSDLVENFTELAFKASMNDPYYSLYIKELERINKGLL